MTSNPHILAIFGDFTCREGGTSGLLQTAFIYCDKGKKCLSYGETEDPVIKWHLPGG